MKHLPQAAADLCASRPDCNAIEVGIRFSLEKAFIIQENGFTIAKTYQINEGENLRLRTLNLAPKMGRTPSATRSSIAVSG